MMFQYNTIIEIGMYRIFYKFLEILVGTRPRPRPRPRQFRSDPAPAPAPAPAKYWTRSVHNPDRMNPDRGHRVIKLLRSIGILRRRLV